MQKGLLYLDGYVLVCREPPAVRRDYGGIAPEGRRLSHGPKPGWIPRYQEEEAPDLVVLPQAYPKRSRTRVVLSFHLSGSSLSWQAARCATSMTCHRTWEGLGGDDARREEERLVEFGFLHGGTGSQHGAAGYRRGVAESRCGVVESRPAAAGKAEGGAAGRP